MKLSKAYREVRPVPKSEIALETKAFNNLQNALQNYKEELEELVPFIRTLVEDLRDYKTLPKSTLRRFANVKPDFVNFKKGTSRSKNQFGRRLPGLSSRNG